MGKRRLMRRFRRQLNLYAPRVATMTGLPERPFTLVWSTSTAVAATDAAAGVIYLNYENWFKDHPDDIGALVHEYTHLIQNVPGGTCPGNVIEGTADTTRYKLSLYDANWWSPSPIVQQMAALNPLDFRLLCQTMAAGTYDASQWPW